MTEKRGMMKLDWASCWKGDNHWISSETLKLEGIKRNFRVKKSTSFFFFYSPHPEALKLMITGGVSGKSVSRFKTGWDNVGKGSRGASPGLSNPEMPHTVTLSELGQQSVKFFMCSYVLPLSICCWAGCWSGGTLLLVWYDHWALMGYGCTFEKHC